MRVPGEVSLSTILSELDLVKAYADAAGVAVDGSLLAPDRLILYVTFQNRQGELFWVEIECQDYPLYPPMVEFVSENRSERGTKKLYPAGFHPTPCVCMRYNRKAYRDRGGPHGDWRFLDWKLPTANGVAIDSLCMIISDLDAKIRSSAGRMA